MVVSHYVFVKQAQWLVNQSPRLFELLSKNEDSYHKWKQLLSKLKTIVV